MSERPILSSGAFRPGEIEGKAFQRGCAVFKKSEQLLENENCLAKARPPSRHPYDPAVLRAAGVELRHEPQLL